MSLRQGSAERVAPFLEKLQGQVCWQVREGYGEQLIMDCGGRVGRTRLPSSGEWRVESQASRWRAIDRHGVDLASGDEPIERAVATLQRVKGARVIHATVTEGLTLRLAFDSGVEVVFDPPADPLDPAWDVFGPGHEILKVTESGRVEVRRSDVPMRDYDDAT